MIQAGRIHAAFVSIARVACVDMVDLHASRGTENLWEGVESVCARMDSTPGVGEAKRSDHNFRNANAAAWVHFSKH